MVLKRIDDDQELSFTHGDPAAEPFFSPSESTGERETEREERRLPLPLRDRLRLRLLLRLAPPLLGLPERERDPERDRRPGDPSVSPAGACVAAFGSTGEPEREREAPERGLPPPAEPERDPERDLDRLPPDLGEPDAADL